VGFAWSPFADENTSIRGGFGFYDVLPLPYEFLVISSSSYPVNDSVSLSNLPAGAFPNLAYADAVVANSGNVSGQRFGYVDPTPSRSYVLQWNLNVEHQFGNPIIVRAAYVGSRGVHLPFRSDDADIVMPTKTSAGYLWPTYGTGVRLNPNIYELDRLDTSADSYYEALQLGTTVHVDRHLDLQVSYTWGKTIDTGSSTIAGNQYTNSPSNLPLWFDPSLRRSVADFNLGQNLVASGTWKVLPQHVHPGTSGLFLNNWRLGAIFQASSGAPFTALIKGDPLGMVSTAPYDYPNRLRTSGCGSAINPGNAAHYIKTECFETPSNPLLLGNSGRNSLVGPGLVNTDFSIAKNGHIPWLSERLGTEFRAEAFNIFNRANFAPPLTNNAIFNDITNSTTQKTTISSLDTAGVITSTQTSSRQLQFTFKVIW
jgi:hypothetical protein